MQAIETFCSSAGWVLFAAGIVHCLLPRSFKLGVSLMLLGDVLLAIAIAFPQKAAALAVKAGAELSSMPENLTAAGVIFALVLLILAYALWIKCFKLRPFWQRQVQTQAAAPTLKQKPGGAASAAHADPALFAHVSLQGRSAGKD